MANFPTSFDNLDTTLQDPNSTPDPETLYIYQSAAIQVINVKYPIQSIISIPGWTEVKTTPGTGQYRVQYRTTAIQFGPVASSVAVVVTYVTYGSIFKASDMNSIASAVNAVEATLGLNPQGSYATVAARINAIAVGTSSPAEPRKVRYTVTSPSGDYIIAFADNIAYPAATLVFRGSELLDDLANIPEYTVSGNSITIYSSVGLEDGDVITIQYFV